jgi:hypothetical protein
MKRNNGIKRWHISTLNEESLFISITSPLCVAVTSVTSVNYG